MKPKLLSMFSNLVRRKSTFLFNPGEQILVLIKTICSLQDKFGNDFKTFWFRFQNDIGTLLLPFLTLLVRYTVLCHRVSLPHPSQWFRYELVLGQRGCFRVLSHVPEIQVSMSAFSNLKISCCSLVKRRVSPT